MKKITLLSCICLVLVGCLPIPTKQADTENVIFPAIQDTLEITPIPADSERMSNLNNVSPISVIVPTGSPPEIDGVLSPGEWDHAVKEVFADGSEMFFIYAAGDLYLGIHSKTPEMIVANIFIHRSDEISILHTSAALGTAIYQRGNDNWQLIQDFTWQCRDTSQSEAARSERQAFLLREGWIAVNSRIGVPEELEFQIKITEETVRLAANIIKTSNTNEKIPWPANLEDDCIKPTPGGLPGTLLFKPETWATLEISR